MHSARWYLLLAVPIVHLIRYDLNIREMCVYFYININVNLCKIMIIEN